MRKFSDRKAAGVGLLIFGVLCLALLLGAVVRHPPWGYTQDVVALAWAFAIAGIFPIATGVALLRGFRSWRRFFGAWLLAACALVASCFPFLPQYKNGAIFIIAGSVFCVSPLLLGGLLLLLWPRR